MAVLPIDEEPLDKFVNRPLAKLTAAVLDPTPITPNQVSGFAGLLGVLAAVAMAWATPSSLVLAALLLWGQLIFDCADGELARRRGGGGWRGQVVDGIADYVVAISIHVGLWILMAKLPGWRQEPWYVVGGIVALAGASMALHSPLFDAAKQVYRVTLGKAAPWLGDTSAARQEVGRLGGAGNRFMLSLYEGYANSQRRFFAWVRADGVPSQAVFIGWCLIGPTLRVTVLSLVLLGCLWSPRAISFYPFFAVLVGNFVLVVLLVTRGRRPAPVAQP